MYVKNTETKMKAIVTLKRHHSVIVNFRMSSTSTEIVDYDYNVYEILQVKCYLIFGALFQNATIL
jgi:hypothetical protein